jgi:RNA polymerase sigma factor (sigma-70 family)
MVSPTLSAKHEFEAQILQLCEHRVSNMVTQDDLEQYGASREELVERTADIISRNLATGRIQRVMKAKEGEGKEAEEWENRGDLHSALQHPGISAQIEGYIDQVIACYLQEHQPVERLAAGDDAEWERLFEQLASRAYNILLRLQVPTAKAVGEAADFAQVSCEAIFSHPFPYDVPFEAWATRILKNQILQRYTRSQDLIDREPGTISLDRPGRGEVEDDFSLHDLLADESSASAFESIEVQEWLIQAIARLRSQAQQQVIIDTFFYELKDEEIARRLGKTRNAVHVLRHRALRRLTQILISEG